MLCGNVSHLNSRENRGRRVVKQGKRLDFTFFYCFFLIFRSQRRLKAVVSDRVYYHRLFLFLNKDNQACDRMVGYNYNDSFLMVCAFSFYDIIFTSVQDKINQTWRKLIPAMPHEKYEPYIRFLYDGKPFYFQVSTLLPKSHIQKV